MAGADSKTKSEPLRSTEDPPQTILGILSRLGPGLIVAGSIVGSGELIATTKTGAEAGFWLLWLILIGCVIKVFVQVEFGRYAITCSETSIKAMNRVPGPSISVSLLDSGGGSGSRGNWLVWYWFAMFLVSLAQLGGIVGGVGQALAISRPLTSAGRAFNEQVDAETEYDVAYAERELHRAKGDAKRARIEELDDKIAKLGPSVIAKRLDVGRQQLAEAEAVKDSSVVGSESAVRLEQLREIDAIMKARAVASPGDPKAVLATTGDDLVGKSREFIDAYAMYGRLSANDHKLWAAMIAIATCFILVMGRYGLIQSFSTVMVASFTVITVANLLALQMTGDWAVTWGEVWNGMQFRLPPSQASSGVSPISTALQTFGIIGVGASELVTYPYWCLEKGYASFTGPRDSSKAWEDRARGWLKVMRWDAMLSMVVYTFATMAFYLLGAAILGRVGLNPGGQTMIRTLAVMYEPVFGSWTQVLFLFGAFAVLYSTFFVANASHARVFPDALRVLNIGDPSERAYRRNVRIYSGVFPLACLFVYIVFPNPAKLVLASGFMQALMLPMLSAAALYFRYYRCDERLKPGLAWDICLWVSAVGMLIAGGWLAYAKLS